MSLIKDNMVTTRPLSTLLPADWREDFSQCDSLTFDNLNHFVHTVSKLKQEQGNNCGISYETAVDMLLKRQTDFPEEEQVSIRNLVRENLLKRGLITQEVYEEFKYTVDGTNVGVDVGKYAAGEAECVMTPAKQYIDFFYELYISISYNCDVSNETVRASVARLLATVEELERQRIFIKINIVLPINNPKHSSDERGNKFFSMIPVFSHKDAKSVSVMSSVVNDRLLRKFYFAILEDYYGDKLSSGYGRAVTLEKALCVGETFNEVELFESIVKETTGA